MAYELLFIISFFGTFGSLLFQLYNIFSQRRIDYAVIGFILFLFFYLVQFIYTLFNYTTPMLFAFFQLSSFLLGLSVLMFFVSIFLIAVVEATKKH